MTDRQASTAATTGSGLTDYEKGYLDGLLRGTRPGGKPTWHEKYQDAATEFLAERGKKGWKINVKRI